MGEYKKNKGNKGATVALPCAKFAHGIILCKCLRNRIGTDILVPLWITQH